MLVTKYEKYREREQTSLPWIKLKQNIVGKFVKLKPLVLRDVLESSSGEGESS